MPGPNRLTAFALALLVTGGTVNTVRAQDVQPVTTEREALGLRQRLLKLGREFIHGHTKLPTQTLIFSGFKWGDIA